MSDRAQGCKRFPQYFVCKVHKHKHKQSVHLRCCKSDVLLLFVLLCCYDCYALLRPGALLCLHLVECLQIDYFPSRNNNITASKIRGNPESTRHISGLRSKVMIEKENNFYQCALTPSCTVLTAAIIHSCAATA